MIGAGLPSIHFHFVSKWLAIDILWKSDENQQKSQGCHIQNNTLKPKKI